MSFWYLASPYSNVSPEVREDRFVKALNATAWALRAKRWVYSPIVHCHQLARDHDFPTDAEFWRDYDFAMLDAAEGVYLLPLPGWKDSRGVKSEIIRAIEHDKEITEIERNEVGEFKFGSGRYNL